MFYQLRIANGKLTFAWKKEEGEHLIIRNKLTKNAYFDKLCNNLMLRNGVRLVDHGIPQTVPLEAVSRTTGREDIVCDIEGISPYYIYYQLIKQDDGTVIMNVQLPGVTKEMEEYIPEEMIYVEMVTPDEATIPLYLPGICSGNNRYWFIEPGANCRVDYRNPKINEEAGGTQKIKDVFKLISGTPQQTERRR